MVKRQKYDPRKAIEEAKKNKDNKVGSTKSAFPEGLIKNSDRGRSMTGLPSIED